MITLREIDDAIREMEDAPHNFVTCQKLATFYLLREYLSGGEIERGYSGNAEPREVIGLHGESEFLRVVAGRNPAAVWSVLDELMGTLEVVNPRLYDGVMRRLDQA